MSVWTSIFSSAFTVQSVPLYIHRGDVLFLWSCTNCESYVYWTVHHLDSWIKRDQLDVTCLFISLFTAQHISDVNTSILWSLRLISWIISWVVLLWFDACWCYGVVRLGWCGIRMQAEAWSVNSSVAPKPASGRLIWRRLRGFSCLLTACRTCEHVTLTCGHT